MFGLYYKAHEMQNALEWKNRSSAFSFVCSRRFTLKASVVLSLCLLGKMSPVEAKTEEFSKRKNFIAFIDCLIPQTDTPSASELMVHFEIYRHARGIENYPALLDYGLGWLEKVALQSFQKGFWQLHMAQQVKILSHMEKAQVGSGERVFFDRVLEDCQRFYYAHAGSWKDLNFAGPPQPDGFLDFSQEP